MDIRLEAIKSREYLKTSWQNFNNCNMEYSEATILELRAAELRFIEFLKTVKNEELQLSNLEIKKNLNKNIKMYLKNIFRKLNVVLFKKHKNFKIK